MGQRLDVNPESVQFRAFQLVGTNLSTIFNTVATDL